VRRGTSGRGGWERRKGSRGEYNLPERERKIAHKAGEKGGKEVLGLFLVKRKKEVGGESSKVAGD